jgi:hypothetical protein
MTLKRWLRTFGVRSARTVFALSLLISCLSFGAGDPASQVQQLKGKAPYDQLRLLNKWRINRQIDANVTSQVLDIDHAVEKDPKPPVAWLSNQIAGIIATLSLEAGSKLSATNTATQIAQDIKKNPAYRDAGVQQQANWMSSAAERLNNLQPSCSNNQATSSGAGGPAMGSFLVYLVYFVLAAGLLGFIVFALSRYSWSKRLERRAKTLLDDDEPERSLDEWLEMADKLEREGKFREAVRCLYLACLLKIDEARIARFERSQTNWEHLARIETSPSLPAGFEFRQPTKAFDEIWYGMRINGATDVERFRTWYKQVVERVRQKAA